MKNKKLYKKDRRGKIIALLIFSFVLMLSVGYTAYTKNLYISGEASFRVEADIRVTDVGLYTTFGNAVEDYNSSYGKDTIKVGVTLPNNNSTITYKVKVTNYGNCAMRLTQVEKLVQNNNYNITLNKNLPLTVGSLSEEEIEVTFSNNTNTSQTVESVLKFTFAKAESLLALGNSSGATSTFFNGPIAKNTVETITFVPTKEVPEEAVGYWDASYTTGSNEVIAYYLNSETQGMYDLYIAASGPVYLKNGANQFYSFTKLKSINFNNAINTEKATNLSGLFYGCTSLTSLDLSMFDTLNVTALVSWNNSSFYNCSSLETLNISNWDTTKITNMRYLFYGCAKLHTLNMTGVNTSNVTSFEGLFINCKKLTSIYGLSSFDSRKITAFNSMFKGCSSLINLDLSSFVTTSATNMQMMFQGCSSLANLNISSFNTSKVTNMSGMFDSCSSITTLNLSHFDTSNVTTFYVSDNLVPRGMFTKCTSLSNLNISSFNTIKVTDMNSMFRGCSSLTTLDLSHFNTSKVTSMANMFYYCTSLSNLDISTFDTSNLSNISGMFDHCSSLSAIDISHFNKHSISNISYIFRGCTSLTSVTLGNLDLSSAKNFDSMFSECLNLESVDLSGLIVNSIETMGYTFSGCKKLKEVDLSSWDLSNLTSLYQTFNGSIALKTIKLNSLVGDKLKSVWWAFNACPIEELDVRNLTQTSNISDLVLTPVNNATIYVKDETVKSAFESALNNNTINYVIPEED